MKNVVVLNGSLKPFKEDPLMSAIENVYKTIREEDELIGFINSPGGYLDSAWVISSLIADIRAKTIVFGSRVDSASVLIFSSFGKRVAFEDASFVIHPGSHYDENERAWKRLQSEEENFKVWRFMAERIKKISAEDLNLLAQKERKLCAEEAKEIGLVDYIVKRSRLEKFFMLLKTGAYCY